MPTRGRALPNLINGSSVRISVAAAYRRGHRDGRL